MINSLPFQHPLYFYLANECKRNGHLSFLGYCKLSHQVCLHFLSGVLVSFSSFSCPVNSRSVQSVFQVLLRDEHFVFRPKHSTAIRLDSLRERQSRNINDKKPIVEVFLDVAKNIDTVCWQSPLQARIPSLTLVPTSLSRGLL